MCTDAAGEASGAAVLGAPQSGDDAAAAAAAALAPASPASAGDDDDGAGCAAAACGPSIGNGREGGAPVSDIGESGPPESVAAAAPHELAPGPAPSAEAGYVPTGSSTIPLPQVLVDLGDEEIEVVIPRRPGGLGLNVHDSPASTAQARTPRAACMLRVYMCVYVSIRSCACAWACVDAVVCSRDGA